MATKGAKEGGCSWKEKVQQKEQVMQKGLPIVRTFCPIPQKDAQENQKQDKQCLVRKRGVRRLKHQQ